MKRNSPEFLEHLKRIGFQKGFDIRKSKGKPFQKGHTTNLGKKRKPFTEEHKRKLGESMEGRIPWNINIKDAQQEYICRHCNNKFWAYKSAPNKKHFCSKKCKGKVIKLTGKDCVFWKGGITPKNMTIRMSSQYKEWRQSVFERDDYTCQECEQIGGKLTAHHKQSFSEYPELRFEVSNGTTLCRDCHRLTENFGAKA